jgi:hypothetical protein
VAGRTRRDSLTSTRGGPRPGRPISLIATHAILALLLVAAAVGLWSPSSDTDAGLFGILLVGELVLLGIGAGIVAVFDRHSPLVLVDVLVGAPLAAGVARGGTLGPGVLAILGMAIIAAAVAGAVLAAIRVRDWPVERLVVAVALAALAVVFVATPLAAALAIVVLAVVAAPDLGRGGRDRPTADPLPRPHTARVRRGAPDAASVLARRPVDRDESA